MAKTIVALGVLFFAMQTQATTANGVETCRAKKASLMNICQDQKQMADGMYFTSCANGFSYRISENLTESNANLTGQQVSCKMVEIRNDKTINKRTTYFDEHSDKVVVYEHTNGLNNTFVYGSTGYYHISELSSGDSLYQFYAF